MTRVRESFPWKDELHQFLDETLVSLRKDKIVDAFHLSLRIHMGTSEVNLEADYCGKEPARHLGKPGLLSENNANVSRKLVCNAYLGPLPVDIHTSVCDAAENMEAASNQSWCSSNIDNRLGVVSSSYSREKDGSSSGFR